jgi:hypothetical protein
MAFTVKIMGPGDMPDHDRTKPFDLFGDVRVVRFYRDEQGASVALTFAAPGLPDVVRTLKTNCYVLNDCGDTVESFVPQGMPIRRREIRAT